MLNENIREYSLSFLVYYQLKHTFLNVFADGLCNIRHKTKRVVCLVLSHCGLFSKSRLKLYPFIVDYCITFDQFNGLPHMSFVQCDWRIL